MNILKRLFDKICLFFVISLIFISCSDFSSGKEWTNISSKGRISISTNLSNAESRTVLPNGSFFTEASGYKWELSAQKSGETSSKVVGTWEDVINSTTGIITTAYKNMTEGSFDILIDVGTYNFNLVATKDGKRVLEGSIINGNIVSGECNRLNFTMKEASGTDIANIANGSINFKLILKKIGVVSNIKANLSELDGSAVVSDENLIPIPADDNSCEYVVFENDSISAGNYMLKLELQQNGVEETIGVYTCIIRVAPGLCSQGEYILEELAELYTITYELNGGNFNENLVDNCYPYNKYTSVVLPTPTREDYAFGGWYNNASLTGEKITEIANGSAENITLYAKWLQLYTITYYLNGGINAESNPTSYTVETETIALADPTKGNNSTFLGWYNESGDEITEIKPSETAANITVTARWRTTCTVSEAKNVILALSGEGPHDIVVTGEITNVNLDIQAIKDGLNGNQGAKVNLDLSQTTGWDELPVWSFEGCINLTSIIIPDGVISIGDTTFQNCSNLKSINIPYGVTSIETKTFNGCSSLTEIIIPDSVTLIGESAFEGCSSLTSVEIPDGVTTISSSAFNGCSSLTSVEIPDGVTTIGSYVFYGCGLTSVTIPDSVTSIGSSAFGYCGSLTSVTIPDGVTTIGSYAFRHCSSLESVTIGNRVTSIGSYAFWYCEKLTSVTIPDNVTSIGIDAFSYCNAVKTLVTGNGLTSLNYLPITNSLESITIGDSITEIGADTFTDCNAVKTLVTGNGLTSLDYLPITSALESITIGDSITEIGDNKFYEFTNLKSVTFADNSQLTKIGENAFCDCSQLTEITIPDGVQTISKGAFGRTGFTSVGLPDSITKMGIDVFCGCSNLVTVKLPNNIESIPAATFYECTNLTSIVIPDGVTSIGDSAFSHCSQLTSITFPESVTTIGINVFDKCSNLTKFIVHEQNQYFSTLEDGKILCDKNKTLIAYPSARGNITIPDGITTIAGNAFVDCTELIEIAIPNSVTSIGNGAFGRTGFTSVGLPDSITKMGIDVFCGCSNLVTVKLPNNIESIPAATFYECTNLTSIVIPDGVTSIGDSAFGYCNSLKTVNYRGSEAQWNTIEKGEGNDILTNLGIIYNYTGE